MANRGPAPQAWQVQTEFQVSVLAGRSMPNTYTYHVAEKKMR